MYILILLQVIKLCLILNEIILNKFPNLDK